MQSIDLSGKYESERVYLRLLEDSDVTDTYLSWFKDLEVTMFLEARDLTKEDVIDYINKGKESQSYFMFAICDKENDTHLGNLKIGPINWKHRFSDLVTVIGHKDYWGKGIATEVIKLGGEVAFDQLDLRKLSGGIYEDNVGSIKCYTRAGWVEEARLKSHFLVDGKPNDYVLVSCFNPKYFS